MSFVVFILQQSLASFKVEIEELTHGLIKDGDCQKFINNVVELDAPRFHNQVVKTVLWVILEQDYRKVNYAQVLPTVRELLDAIQHQKLLTKEEVELLKFLYIFCDKKPERKKPTKKFVQCKTQNILKINKWNKT